MHNLQENTLSSDNFSASTFAATVLICGWRVFLISGIYHEVMGEEFSEKMVLVGDTLMIKTNKGFCLDTTQA
jgi:hypothetical protein